MLKLDLLWAFSFSFTLSSSCGQFCVFKDEVASLSNISNWIFVHSLTKLNTDNPEQFLLEAGSLSAWLLDHHWQNNRDSSPYCPETWTNSRQPAVVWGSHGSQILIMQVCTPQKLSNQTLSHHVYRLAQASGLGLCYFILLELPALVFLYVAVNGERLEDRQTSCFENHTSLWRDHFGSGSEEVAHCMKSESLRWNNLKKMEEAVVQKWLLLWSLVVGELCRSTVC